MRPDARPGQRRTLLEATSPARRGDRRGGSYEEVRAAIPRFGGARDSHRGRTDGDAKSAFLVPWTITLLWFELEVTFA